MKKKVFIITICLILFCFTKVFASEIIYSFTPSESKQRSSAIIQDVPSLEQEIGPGVSPVMGMDLQVPAVALLPQEYFKIESRTHNYTWDSLEKVMLEEEFKTLRQLVTNYENSKTNGNFNAICQLLLKYNSSEKDTRILADYLVNFYGTRVYARYFLDENLNARFAPINGLTPSQITPSEEYTYQQMWQYIKALIPPEDLKSIEMFLVDSDGKLDTIATIFTLSSDYSNAVLTCDIFDFFNNEVFKNSVIHEYGHLLTLNASQCDPVEKVEAAGHEPLIYNGKPYNSVPDYEKNGLRYSDASYITFFYNAFWTKYLGERDLEKVDSKFKTKYINSGEFINELTMKNVREDIAESFAYFVLHDPPQGTEVWKQKVMFFYQFPTLLQKRTYIRTILGLVP